MFVSTALFMGFGFKKIRSSLFSWISALFATRAHNITFHHQNCNHKPYLKRVLCDIIQEFFITDKNIINFNCTLCIIVIVTTVHCSRPKSQQFWGISDIIQNTGIYDIFVFFTILKRKISSLTVVIKFFLRSYSKYSCI